MNCSTKPPLLHRGPILLVEGILQKRDGTIRIRGRRFDEINLDSQSAIAARLSLSLGPIQKAPAELL